jgi:hypothetical protein
VLNASSGATPERGTFVSSVLAFGREPADFKSEQKLNDGALLHA